MNFIKFLCLPILSGLLLTACRKEPVPTAEIVSIKGSYSGISSICDDSIPDMLVELYNLDGSRFFAANLYAKSECTNICRTVYDHICTPTTIVPDIGEQQKTIKISQYLDYPNNETQPITTQTFYIWSPNWLGDNKNNKFESRTMDFDQFSLTIDYQW